MWILVLRPPLERRITGHRVKDAPPHALAAPSAEAPEDAVPFTEHRRQVAPRRPRAHDPQHALDEHPVVPSRRALLVGPTDDQRRNPPPRPIAQHQTIHHTQDRLPKSSLESRFARLENP